MEDAALVRRVEMLEETLESLKTLPDRVTTLEVRVTGLESQVLQLRTEMTDGFSAIHQDLKRFATKEDLERFATKEDLERYATREDLGRFATSEDLQGLAIELRRDMADMRDDTAAGFREMAGQILESERRLAARIGVLVEDAVERAFRRREGNPGAF